MTDEQPPDQQQPATPSGWVPSGPAGSHRFAGPPTPPADDADGAQADEGFSLIKAFGGWGGMLDAGLPGLAFVVTYTAFGNNLRYSLIVALSLGAVFTVVRLVRRDPLQNVIGGFVGVAIAAVIANATGKAGDFYLPGLFINAAYALGYLIANILKWPLIGVVVGLAAGWGTAWRQDPLLLRAFQRAGWLWVGFFVLKLAVQLPLYLTDQLVALGVARVAMGWPLWLLVMWLTYVVVRGSVPTERWAQVKQAADQLAQRQAAK
ncbi:DUF3159 domain-containing protein [Actinopolymorpha alba]|uniref:DUF3159 domain-containing protein n=1 Tax=Actinopolymorpha alba TaxID=533267 RepID=UPI000365D534|nr:DUF3159 domain-containing protein [Actinopolymorpha alba]